MPKIRTHRGTAKRVKVTATGKVLHRHQFSGCGHILVYVRRALSREIVLFRHILTQSIHLKPSLNSQRAHCQRV